MAGAYITPSNFSSGTKIEYKGDIWEVIEYLNVHKGRGSAFVRTKLKNLKTGNVIEVSFSPDEKLPYPEIVRKNVVFLYKNGNTYVFMDNETYEQIEIDEDFIGNNKNYLIENLEADILMVDGKILGLQLPKTVELKIIETPPGFKGDTVAGGSKPATLETGLVVNVPLYLNEGEIIKVDTRTGEFVERVKS